MQKKKYNSEENPHGKPEIYIPCIKYLPPVRNTQGGKNTLGYLNIPEKESDVLFHGIKRGQGIFHVLNEAWARNVCLTHSGEEESTEGTYGILLFPMHQERCEFGNISNFLPPSVLDSSFMMEKYVKCFKLKRVNWLNKMKILKKS